MKQQTEIIESKIKTLKYLLYISFLSLISIIFVSVAFAQKETDVIAQPLKINGKEVKEYLMEKYKLSTHDVTSELKQTPNGPSGDLSIGGGNIKPKNVVIINDTLQGRARAIARAFLEEETNLFGITNMDEIREVGIDAFTSPYTNLTTTNVRYQRYINNLELEYAYIRITIGTNENIRSISAKLVAVPPELYEAVKKQTLSETEIRRIVDDDLKVNVKTPQAYKEAKITKLNKYAISSQPYVVWKVESVWFYTINAFTGEILNKEPNWIIEFPENDRKK